MVFRKICQIVGVLLVGLGVWLASERLISMLNGETTVFRGILGILLELTLVSGLGMMFLLFDPHRVIQSDSFSLHRLVQPRRDTRSFAEKIHVGEDDD